LQREWSRSEKDSRGRASTRNETHPIAGEDQACTWHSGSTFKAPILRVVSVVNHALPVARRLSSAVRALSPARTKRFDSCQVQLGTRSAIFAVGQHFVQGAPFAIPTAPGADLLDRLRARVPSEVAPETLLCRRSYRQAVQPGIKLPLHNFEPMSAHQTLVGLFNRFFESEPGFQHPRDVLRK
jgi:hypothetical protein